MSRWRGYSVGRGAKGIRRRGVPRAVCPSCGKRGMGPWKPAVTAVGPYLLRGCRYCQHHESQRVST